jgi:hypothetical protein
VRSRGVGRKPGHTDFRWPAVLTRAYSVGASKPPATRKARSRRRCRSLSERCRHEDQNLLPQNLSSCEGASVSYDDADDARLLPEAAKSDQAAFGVFYAMAAAGHRLLPAAHPFARARVRSDRGDVRSGRGRPAAVRSRIGVLRPAGCSRSPSTSRSIACSERGSRARPGRGWATSPLVLEDRDLERVEQLASLGDASRLDRLLAQSQRHSAMPCECA